VFLALGIQIEMRMPHIVKCDLLRFTVLSTLSYKRYDFRKKKVTEHKTFRVCLQRVIEKCLILRRNEQNMIKDLYWSPSKIFVIVVGIQ
jgi:hypothetical protein